MSSGRIKKSTPSKKSKRFSFANVKKQFSKIPMFKPRKNKPKNPSLTRLDNQPSTSKVIPQVQELLNEKKSQSPGPNENKSKFNSVKEYQSAALVAFNSSEVNWAAFNTSQRSTNSDDEEVIVVPKLCHSHEIDAEMKTLEKQKKYVPQTVPHRNLTDEGEILSSDDEVVCVGVVDGNPQAPMVLNNSRESAKNKPMTKSQLPMKNSMPPRNNPQRPNFSQMLQDNASQKISNVLLNQLPSNNMAKSNFQFVPNNQSLRNLRPFRDVYSSNTNPSWQERRGGFQLKLCTFNVLCENIKEKCAYLYTNKKQKISWEQRWQLLLGEIAALNADIFCLQEVQADHFANYFEPLFHEAGFMCHYTRRGGIQNTDGCMLVYRKEMFTELRFEHVYYNYDVDGFDKHNVGQVISLRENTSGLIFIVANTHILFNMNRGDIKAGQVALLLATVNKFAAAHESNDKYSGTFLCGDFNIEPHSPIYQFIRNGFLPYMKYFYKSLAYAQSQYLKSSSNGFHLPGNVPLDLTTCEFVESSSSERLTLVDNFYHKMRFLSAYCHTTENHEPEISTYHKDSACPDFIFYSGAQATENSPIDETRIIIKKILILPSLRILKMACGPMPNEQCGSDHLPLVAEFYIF